MRAIVAPVALALMVFAATGGGAPDTMRVVVSPAGTDPSERANLQATFDRAAAQLEFLSRGKTKATICVSPSPTDLGACVGNSRVVMGVPCSNTNTACSDCHGARIGWYMQLSEDIAVHEWIHTLFVCDHSFGASCSVSLMSFDASFCRARERAHPFSIMGGAGGPYSTPTVPELLILGWIDQSQVISVGRETGARLIALSPIEDLVGTVGLYVAGGDGRRYAFEYRTKRSGFGSVISVMATVDGYLSYVGTLRTGEEFSSATAGINAIAGTGGAITLAVYPPTAEERGAPAPPDGDNGGLVLGPGPCWGPGMFARCTPTPAPTADPNVPTPTPTPCMVGYGAYAIPCAAWTPTPSDLAPASPTFSPTADLPSPIVTPTPTEAMVSTPSGASTFPSPSASPTEPSSSPTPSPTAPPVPPPTLPSLPRGRGGCFGFTAFSVGAILVGMRLQRRRRR